MSPFSFRCANVGRLSAVVAAGLLVGACATKAPPTAVLPVAAAPNVFADSTMRRIATLQDERRTVPLLNYLIHPEPRYRQRAALAFASVQDKAATAALSAHLNDSAPEVRQLVAYALGQTADTTAEGALQQRLTTEENPVVRRYVLEALGRCTSRAGLPQLVRLPSALATDTAALVGQGWGLYRAGMRDVTSEAAVARLLQLLAPANPYGARLAAANALARTRGLDLTPFAAAISSVAQKDPHYAVRSAAVGALSKTTNVATVPALLAGLARRDPDYRVRVAALRTMNTAMYAPVKEAAWAALGDPSQQVALTAAEFFLAHATHESGASFLEKANKMPNWRVRATLLAAALKQRSPEQAAIRRAVQERYAAATSPYEKGALLKALGEDPAAFEIVRTIVFEPQQALVVGTDGMEALIAMRQQPDFPVAQQAAFALILRRAIASGDVAQIGLAAEALRDPRLTMRKLLPDTDFLHEAQAKLLLPRDLEAWQSVQQTIDFLEQHPATPTPVALAASHPINWTVVEAIPATQRAVVHTSRGDIMLRLLVEEAPGSVASFVELVRQDFYNGKSFHRVVPNFVVQGGCPRGDGWGSTDYNLRSELADLRYGAGAVGLASAGKDTESCQWFITHAPTPHLDGRYTIFAQVVSGMDVVEKLEIGDQIEQIELLR